MVIHYSSQLAVRSLLVAWPTSEISHRLQKTCLILSATNFSLVPTYSASKDSNTWPVVLTFPDCEDLAVMDNPGFLTRTKEVRSRSWTEIADCHASMTSGLVECNPCKDQNWLHGPSIGETAGALYKECLACYLADKDCLLYKKDC